MLNKLLEKFFRFGAKMVVRLTYSCAFKGFEENIPKEGGALIIANHVSYMDGLILNCASPRPIRFIIDEDIYNLPLVNYFMRMDRAIPVKASKDSVRSMIEKVTEAISQGDLVAIFPEGQITYSGNLSRFKFGIEWLLKENQVDVIPIVLDGLWGSVFSRKYLDPKYKFKFIPRYYRMKIKAICGKPIPHEKATINYLQRQMMKMIAEIRLAGQ